MEWLLYTRGTIHLHRISCAFLGIKKYASKLNGVPFPAVLYINEGSKLWWGWNEKATYNLGNHILKKCSSKTGAKKHLVLLEKYGKDAIRKAELAISRDLSTMSNQELRKWYQKLYTSFEPAHALMDTDIDVIDVVFEPFFSQLLKKELPSNDQKVFNSVYRKLSTPAYVSYLTRQELELMQLAQHKKIQPSQIEKIFTAYWWTSLGWENMKPHSRNYFEKQITLLQSKKNIKKELHNIKIRTKSILNERSFVIKKYHLSKNISHWIWVLDRYNALHDLRKEMQVKTTYSLHLVLLEIHKRFGYRVEDMEWLWNNEVVALLNGRKQIDLIEIKKRKQCTYAVIAKKSIAFLSGRAAVLAKNKELKIQKINDSELKGLGVTQGKATGKVKVCNGYQDALAKVEKGDILVTGMTLPDYLPAMKKAAAIVTDEGGITCHAAIVSRELKKVCVVGTKHATQIFKDGDTVEVDATNGVVRKIK